MEYETIRPTEGFLEPVHQGSVTFNQRILAPLRSSYLYKESKDCFTYNCAQLINNATLEKRYAAFRSEKREKGYSEQELEESFGFLLFDDANRARDVGVTGLLVGQSKCSTLGDPLTGVYVSKYSDCLDPKCWYNGKTGYIVILKLTKGRVKEVKANYSKNLATPTPGFDCHVSDLFGSVSSTTRSSVAFEATKYYLYEHSDGSVDSEPCPRHVCPIAIVDVSYGKISTSSDSEKKSQDRTVFQFQPWIGQLKIESLVYDVGLQSTNGALFPTKLPKTVKIDHAIGVSELKRSLPREVFETCIVGEVCIGGRCFNLYDVVSSKAKQDLAQIAQELKEKNMALVIPLEDSGFLVLLHSSHLFSYEDAKSGKVASLQGMFIFPDSRTIPRGLKSGLEKTKQSSELTRVIPALNYAETKMEKSTQDNHEASWTSLEKHLQDYHTHFQTDNTNREASLLPDQFNVPGGFTLISPKWTKEARTRLKSYFDEPCGFTIPVRRALELLDPGRKEDHDDVYRFISSPEDMSQTDNRMEVDTTGSDGHKEPSTESSRRHGKGGKEPVDKTFQVETKGDGTPNQTSSTPVVTSTVDGLIFGGEIPAKRKDDPKNMRKGKKRKIHWKTLKTKKRLGLKTLNVFLPVISNNVSIIDQTDTGAWKVDDDNQKPPSTRGTGDFKHNVSKSRKEKIQDHSLNVPTESVNDPKMKVEASSSKQDWRSLPRSKRVWNPDANLKRSLRSSNGKNEKEHAEVSLPSLPSTTKRKIEGYSLRGLKTIITNCGRVFVPHGSEIDAGCLIRRQTEQMQFTKPVENKSEEIEESQSRSTVKEEVPCKDALDLIKADSVDGSSKEIPGALLSALNILKKCHQNIPKNPDKSQTSSLEIPLTASSNKGNCFQKTNQDIPVAVQADTTFSPPRNSDQSMNTDVKVSSPDKSRKKAKHGLYSAISISKLKTILKRGKTVKSPSSHGEIKVEEDPESKRRKLNSIVEIMYDISKNALGEDGSECLRGEQQFPTKTGDLTKQPKSFVEVDQKVEKEKGPHNFEKSAPKRQHLVSSHIAEKLGRRKNVKEEKVNTERFYKNPSLSSDALSLLADLALGASNDKRLSNPEIKTGQEALDVVKASGSPESVLHALLRYPPSRFKLPPRSPSPESLLATGELILEISKEHSYSQSTSSSGVSGPSSPTGCVDSVFSTDGLYLTLKKDKTHQEEEGKTVSPKNVLPFIKSKLRKTRFLRHRRIIEKQGTIRVMRIWKEAYDFKFDSKFTNESIDKTITRALHGKWNFNIEDTFDDVHLIFHMWIGLFYSKSTSRLFQLENSTALSKERDNEKVPLDKDAIQNAVSSLNVELSPDEVVHMATEVLDLSARNGESLDLCSVSRQNQTRDSGSLPVGVVYKKYKMGQRQVGTGASPGERVDVLMKYRSAVNTPQDNQEPDRDSETEDENDTTTDCSYSQLLEANCAYNQLCKQASNLRIGVHLPKDVFVVYDKASSPVTTTDLKKSMAYKIIKPAEFSIPSQLMLGVKHLEFGLNLETEHKPIQKEDKSEMGKRDDCPEVVDGESVDELIKEFNTSVKNQSPVLVNEENKQVSDEDSQDGCLMIVEDEYVASETPNQEKTVVAKDLKPLEDSSNVDDHNADLSHESSVIVISNTNLLEHVEEQSGISSNKQEQNETFVEKDQNERNVSLLKNSDTFAACEMRPESNQHFDAQDLNDSANMTKVLTESSSDTTFYEMNKICNATEEPDQVNPVNTSPHMTESEEHKATEEEMGIANMEGITEDVATAETSKELTLCDNVEVKSLETKCSEADTENIAEMDALDSNSPRDKSSARFILSDEECEVQSEVQLQAPIEENFENVIFEDFYHDTCSDKSSCAVVQDESENMTLGDKSMVQREILETCQHESQPVRTGKSLQLCTSDSELDHKDTLDPENTKWDEMHPDKNEPRSQSLKSGAALLQKIHSVETITPQNLVKPPAMDLNSPCSTPPKGETLDFLEESEKVRKHELERKLYFPDNSVRVVQRFEMLPHLSPVSPHTTVSNIKPFSESKELFEETRNNASKLKRSDFTDEWGSVLTTNQETDRISMGGFENDYDYYYGDNEEDWNGYCHGSTSEWHDYEAEEQIDQFYACDSRVDDDLPTCSKYLKCEREFYFKNKKDKKDVVDEYCWGNDDYRSDNLSIPIRVTCTVESYPKKKSRKREFTHAFDQDEEWGDEESTKRLDNIPNAPSFETDNAIVHRPITVGSLAPTSRQRFDWGRYFRRVGTFKEEIDVHEKHDIFDVPPSSIVTILGREGSRVIFSNPPTAKRSCTENGSNKELERSFNRWQELQDEVDGTWSTLENEYLIFTDKMNTVLKESKSCVSGTSQSLSNPQQAPMALQFSSLSEVESFDELKKAPTSLAHFKIKVDLSDRKESVEKMQGAQEVFPGVSEITERCAVSYKSMMKDVCREKTRSQADKSNKRKCNQGNTGKPPRISCRIRKYVFESPQDSLKTTMRQASKTKYRFYVHVTSTDSFFEETKNLMEIEGHTPVVPDKFELENDQFPLLIIVRNEDVAEHICEVPKFLELKKSPNVHFAGIDRPDDVVNLTHQELFAKGGFIVCDDLALDTLSLDDMTKIVGILEELGKQGRWKWFLHYRDSRRLRESAKSSPEANKKQQFIEFCQRAGIVDLLPYHDCDLLSRDLPDYLFCLTRLQIQNASVRFPVFITDTPTEAFGTKGILTMNIYTFSRMLSNDKCSVS